MLDEAKKEKLDLILLDGVLAKADNFNGFNQLKLASGLDRIPVIISTTKAELGELRKKLEGVTSYCLKPFDYTDLVRRIRVALLFEAI